MIDAAIKHVIQIGTYDKPDENISKFLNKLGYFCYLVEGNKKAFDIIDSRLKESGISNYTIDNILISDYNGERDFYLYTCDSHQDPNEVFGQHSVDKQHLVDFGLGKGYIKEVKMPCYTLETFINNKNLSDKEIEWLWLDTDRHDCDILLSTDFSKINIKNLVFEDIHSDGTYKKGHKFMKCIYHLQKFGYTIQNFDESNTIAYK